MNLLGKTLCGGNLYALTGTIPFDLPELQTLEYGDAVKDNNGTGITKSVNVCCQCGKKYLNSTLILIPTEGPCCYVRPYTGWY